MGGDLDVYRGVLEEFEELRKDEAGSRSAESAREARRDASRLTGPIRSAASDEAVMSLTSSMIMPRQMESGSELEESTRKRSISQRRVELDDGRAVGTHQPRRERAQRREPAKRPDG